MLKSFQNYFSDIEHVEKYSRGAISPRNNFEKSYASFHELKYKLFHTDMDEG